MFKQPKKYMVLLIIPFFCSKPVLAAEFLRLNKEHPVSEEVLAQQGYSASQIKRAQVFQARIDNDQFSDIYRISMVEYFRAQSPTSQAVATVNFTAASIDGGTAGSEERGQLEAVVAAKDVDPVVRLSAAKNLLAYFSKKDDKEMLEIYERKYDSLNKNSGQ